LLVLPEMANKDYKFDQFTQALMNSGGKTTVIYTAKLEGKQTVTLAASLSLRVNRFQARQVGA